MALTSLLLVSGCQTASHLPSPVELPGAAIGSAIENIRYTSHRRKVKAYLDVNWDAIHADAEIGDGPTLKRACKVANIREEKCRALREDIIRNPALYREASEEDALENLTVAFMVFGN